MAESGPSKIQVNYTLRSTHPGSNKQRRAPAESRGSGLHEARPRSALRRGEDARAVIAVHFAEDLQHFRELCDNTSSSSLWNALRNKSAYRHFPMRL